MDRTRAFEMCGFVKCIDVRYLWMSIFLQL